VFSSLPEIVHKFNGHYYEFFNLKTTLFDGRVYAQNVGGYLATITSNAENEFVSGIRPGAAPILLGGSDRFMSNLWRWLDGPVP